jgi:hypothetical protein
MAKRPLGRFILKWEEHTETDREEVKNYWISGLG